MPTLKEMVMPEQRSEWFLLPPAGMSDFFYDQFFRRTYSSFKVYRVGGKDAAPRGLSSTEEKS